MKHSLSIVIPLLNEEKYIGKLLAYLAENSSAENIKEILVVDGGSTDKSRQIVSAFQNVVLLDAPKGRASQMNHGAQVATGSILYFLHADTFPPKDFDKKIIEEVNKNNSGCFRLKFEQPNHFLLKIPPFFTQFKSLLFRGGDQSLFIKKKEFHILNGFDERYKIFEDLEFIKRLYKSHNFKIINDYVITSERRFRAKGVWSLYYRFLMIHIKSRLGASPEELYRYYERFVH